MLFHPQTLVQIQLLAEGVRNIWKYLAGSSQDPADYSSCQLEKHNEQTDLPPIKVFTWKHCRMKNVQRPLSQTRNLALYFTKKLHWRWRKNLCCTCPSSSRWVWCQDSTNTLPCREGENWSLNEAGRWGVGGVGGMGWRMQQFWDTPSINKHC